MSLRIPWRRLSESCSQQLARSLGGGLAPTRRRRAAAPPLRCYSPGLAARRGFANPAGVDAEVVLRLRSMRRPGQVLNFATKSEGAGADAFALEASLRTLGRMVSPESLLQPGAEEEEEREFHGWTPERVASDGRFHVLLASLAAHMDGCGARTLAFSADAAARFPGQATPELRGLLERAALSAATRENAFTPRNLTKLAMALASRGVHGTRYAIGAGGGGEEEEEKGAATLGVAVAFVRGEAMRQMQEFDISCCAALLEAFRRWGVHDRELVDMALERVWDVSDYKLTCRDVVDTLAVMARLGLTRDALLGRLRKIAFGQLREFSGWQLVTVLHALSRLRFLSPGHVDDALRAVTPELGRPILYSRVHAASEATHSLPQMRAGGS